MLKSHSLTPTLSHYLTLTMSHSHTLTLSLSHSLTLHMLNNFCFHVYAQKSLFIAENCNVFWDIHIITITLSCEFRGHTAGSQLKMVGRLPATAGCALNYNHVRDRCIDLLTTLITDQASCTWDNHNKSFFLCNEWSSENKTWGLFKLLLIEAIV